MIRVWLGIGLLAAVVAIAIGELTTPMPAPPAPGMVAIPEPGPAAIRYQRTGLALWFVGRAWTLAIPVLVLATGWSGRISRFASGRDQNRPRVVTVAIFAAIYFAIEFALKFPLRYYAGFVRLHDYGLSTQTFGRWFGDSVKGLGIEVAGAALFAWVPFALLAWSPRRWWLWTGILILPFSVGSALVAPVLIDPLFNDFGSMTDPAIEAKITNLAERAGITGSKIYEVDKSRDTTTVNAYVTGMFGTKRIVLWDTIIAKLAEDELLVVMGHEMGHYVLNHVALGISLGSLAVLLGLYVVHHAAGAAVTRWSRRFGFDRLDNVAALPLLLVLVEVMMLLTSPVTNAASRWMEHEADRFALELTHTNHAAATGFAKLQRDNLAVPFPDPFTRIWRSSHPSIGERISFCNTYRPWESGEPTPLCRPVRTPLTRTIQYLFWHLVCQA